MILKRGLIVSCQACEGEPLYNLDIMKYMARAAVFGGAVGIRALAAEIPSIKKEVDVPVIGLVKKIYENSDVYITPTKDEIDLVLASGADAIAIDATQRTRHNNQTPEELVAYIRKKAPDVEIIADIDTVENAVFADKLGVEYVSSTLRGYTKETKNIKIPDVVFLKKLKKVLKKSKLIVEGGIWEKKDLQKVLKIKPYAVIIGTAITRPKDITLRFAGEFKGESL